MLQSKLFIKTRKEAPKDEIFANARLLIRGSFIDKLMAGVYSFLPLGFRVLKKIEGIVREEIEALGAGEILMPALHPKTLWEETGRWQKLLGIIYKVTDKDGREFGLGPTHEEVIVDIIRKHTITLTDLPFSLFQMQTKFRDEPRAKSGLLRGREFSMKDLYSFHADENDLKKFYDKAIKSYLKIFKRCGLKPLVVEASGGEFSKEYSHEFMIKTPAGEDVTFFCSLCGFAQNKEIAKVKAGDKCPNCRKGIIEEAKTVEAGNIFKLGTRFSEELGAHYTDEKGEKKPLVMGCYGIGLGRLMATVVEVHNDEKGIVWPREISPFAIHLIEIPSKKTEIKKQARKLYKLLLAENAEVLYDDRGVSAGVKFADADLIGCPLRIVVSERTLESGCVEVKERSKTKAKLIKINKLKAVIKNHV